MTDEADVPDDDVAHVIGTHHIAGFKYHGFGAAADRLRRRSTAAGQGALPPESAPGEPHHDNLPNENLPYENPRRAMIEAPLSADAEDCAPKSHLARSERGSTPLSSVFSILNAFP